MRAGRRSRALLVTAAAVGAFAALPASQAAAHVHGITPLRCVGTDNDGAARTDTTPAARANGGPIGEALIPRDPGRSQLGIGDGGFDTPACPVVP
jgi:hypothetical protein